MKLLLWLSFLLLVAALLLPMPEIWAIRCGFASILLGILAILVDMEERSPRG